MSAARKLELERPPLRLVPRAGLGSDVPRRLRAPHGGVAIQSSPGGASLPSVSGLQWALLSKDITTAQQAGLHTGTAQSVTFVSGSTWRITDSGGAFVAGDIGMYIRIVGSGGALTGTFPVTARTTTTCDFTWTSGSADSGSIPYTLCGRASGLTDRVANLAFAQATDANRLIVYDGVISSSLVTNPPTLDTKYFLMPAAAARYLALTNSTVAGKFNGNGTCSFAVCLAVLTFGTARHVAITDNITTFANSTSVSNQSAAIGMRFAKVDSGGTTNSDDTGGINTAQLFTLAWCYQTPNVQEYIDGAASSLIAQSPTRSPASMTISAFGSTTSSGVYLYLGAIAANTKWTATEAGRVNTWFRAQYPGF